METTTLNPPFSQENSRLPLKEGQSSYKLFIPKEVREKIELWCKVSPTTEWSGTLFYKPEGHFEDSSLTIKIVDFLVSDIGSSTYTEYDVKPEIISYMLENSLLDCKCGLIHSHNQMSCFFSGTDISTLQSEGASAPHFVSLIVNNRGPYCARITRKVTSRVIGTEEKSYSSFDDSNITINPIEVEPIVNTYLEWFNLDIEIEGKINNPLEDEIRERYETILKEKRTVSSNNVSINTPSFPSYEKWKKEKEEKEEKEKKEVKITTTDVNIDSSPHFSKEVIDELTGQILFGSISLSAESFRKLDKVKWIKETMPERYGKRFDKNTKVFELWAAEYIDFIVNNVTDNDLINLGYDQRLLPSIIARDIKDNLKKIATGVTNSYFSAILNILDDYIIEEEEDFNIPIYPSSYETTGNLFNSVGDGYYDND